LSALSDYCFWAPYKYSATTTTTPVIRKFVNLFAPDLSLLQQFYSKSIRVFCGASDFYNAVALWFVENRCLLSFNININIEFISLSYLEKLITLYFVIVCRHLFCVFADCQTVDRYELHTSVNSREEATIVPQRVLLMYFVAL